ncbi:MAG TPA: S24 family peptidase [Treponemataceae bacterium]|nr:S24 family peptidase [Treponemataceae bacterium]
MANETGFPSPARGYEANTIDLNTLMVHNAPATFFMRMQGGQLIYRGILSGDMLVIDRSRPPMPGCLVVFRREGEFACRELRREGERLLLADGCGEGIKIDEETEIFGVVTGVVRSL